MSNFNTKRDFLDAKIKEILNESTTDRLWKLAGRTGFEFTSFEGKKYRAMDMALGLALRNGLNFLEGKSQKGDIIIIKKG